MKYLRHLLIVALSLLLVFQVSAQPVSGSLSSSTFSAQKIGTYSKERLSAIADQDLQAFLTGSSPGFAPFKGKFEPPAYSVDLYKLQYASVVPELGDRPVMASGLVAIPNNSSTSLPVLSYQHGTVFEKTSVPSRPDQSIETRLVLARFAAQGHVVIAADYLGLGDSSLSNSYFVRDSIEQATFDLYAAALKFLQDQGKHASHLSTFGWSQGGYSNMVFLRKLEREGIPVTASVTAAGAVDLGLFVLRGLTNPRAHEASFAPAALSNMLFAFSRYKDEPHLAREAIRPEFFPSAAAFYDFQIDFAEFYKRVPSDPRLVLKPEFIRQMTLGQGSFVEILDASASYRWLSKTPLRAYHGGSDEAVPDFIAKLAVDYQKILGKRNAQALSAGPDADHRATYVHALIDAKPWIDQLIQAAGQSKN